MKDVDTIEFVLQALLHDICQIPGCCRFQGFPMQDNKFQTWQISSQAKPTFHHGVAAEGSTTWRSFWKVYSCRGHTEEVSFPHWSGHKLGFIPWTEMMPLTDTPDGDGTKATAGATKLAGRCVGFEAATGGTFQRVGRGDTLKMLDCHVSLLEGHSNKIRRKFGLRCSRLIFGGIWIYCTPLFVPQLNSLPPRMTNFVG